MKKDAYYFPHFSNARNDSKILKLRRVLGLEGYAIYFMLLEILREQTDYSLPLSSLPELAFEFRVSEEKISTVIMDYDLFTVNESKFFSPKLLLFLQPWIEKSSKMRENALKRWENANAMQLHSKGNARKGKEIKEKEIKEKEIKEKEIKEKPALPFGEAFFHSWNDWLDYRRESKKKMTEATIKKQLNFLSKYTELEATQIISQSIQNGWQGLFELNQKKNGKQQIDSRQELLAIYQRDK